jgi:hypothetical protein
MAFNVGKQSDIFSKLKTMAPAKRLDLFNKTKYQEGGTPFTLLTPEQFAELFPRYYREAKPDVAGFQRALSKGTSGGEKTSRAGEAQGTANVATGEKVTNVVRAREIYDYLRQKGVDHNHAVGIVNNMKYESNFNSGAIGDGGTSGGLFQHHASRFTAMKNYVGDDWKTNWKKQIDFALTEGEMKTYLGKNFANGRDASMGFTKDFERPANTDATAAYRAGTAEGYGSEMSNRAGNESAPGGSYEISSSGYVVPKDKSLYDQKNEEQCATLAKAFNPNIGRSHSWSVVDGEIKPGMTVATMRYNLPGGDRTGSGYHAGVAMTTPDKDGKFWLLEQFSGKKPQLRQVNANSYDGGAMGGTVKFGIIQSDGKLHNEQSVEALRYGAALAPNDEIKNSIMGHHDAILKGGSSGPETATGSVTTNDEATVPDNAPGPQTNLQQQETVKSIQTATVGDMMRFAGDLAGFFTQGEGLGDSRGKKKGRGNAKPNFDVDVMPSEVKDHLSPVDSLLSLIGQGEGGYNSINKGSGKSFGSVHDAKFGGKSLSELTIAEIMKKQEGTRGSGREIFAAGRFQIIPQTMKRAVALAGISKDEVFNEDTQKRLAMALIQNRPHLNAYLTGKSNDLHAAQLDLSEEWASLPDPKTGRSHYKGGNKASHTLEQVKESLVSARTEIAAKSTDTRIAQAPEKPTAPTPAPTPAQPSQTQTAKVEKAPPKSFYQKAKDYFESLVETPLTAKEVKQTPPAVPSLTPSVLAPSFTKDSQPLPGVDKKNLDPAMMAPDQMYKEPQKQSFNMQPATAAKPQQTVNIDKFLERSNPAFPTPSLERAMRNTHDPSGAAYDHFGGTKIG